MTAPRFGNQKKQRKSVLNKGTTDQTISATDNSETPHKLSSGESPSRSDDLESPDKPLLTPSSLDDNLSIDGRVGASKNVQPEKKAASMHNRNTDEENIGTISFDKYMGQELSKKKEVKLKQSFPLRLDAKKVAQVDELIAEAKNKNASRNSFYDILTDYALMNADLILKHLNSYER